MAAPQRLQNPSISPAARPVDQFLQFDANSAPAQPTRSVSLAQPKGITTIQRGGMRNVQGVNPLEELTTALQPLSKLYDAGVGIYASDQYRRGQNEILRAAANINRDTIAKGYKYAEDNRALSAENPIAGVLMDQTNPFREAGRINQASRWAASVVPSLMRAKWAEKAGELARLDPSDPKIRLARAEVVRSVSTSLGLDEFSPGFQQYVLPEINRSSEWFDDQQLQANVKYQKEAGVRQTSEVLNSILRQGVLSEQVDRERWGNELAEAAARFGITGEPEAMTRKAILQSIEYWTTIAYNQGLPPEARQLAANALIQINQLPSGLKDANGADIPIGIAFSSSSLSAQADVARDLKALSDSQKDLQIQAATDDLSGVNPTQLQSGEQLNELVERLRKKYPDLNTFEIYEIINQGVEATSEFEQNLFNSDDLDVFFTEADGLVGSDWDEAEQRRRFDQLTVNAKGDNRIEANRRWNELKARKAAEQKAGIDRAVINGNINNAAKAAVIKLFPEDGVDWIKEAEARGQSVVQYLGTLKGNQAAAIQQITSSLQRTIISRIQKETAANRGALSFTEQGDIAQEEIDKLMNDEAKLRRLADIPEKTKEEEKKQQEPSSQPVEIPQVYLPGASVPEAAAKGNKPIYSKKDTEKLFFLAAAGKPIPAAVKRAARAANMTPGEFILKQFELHGLEPTDDGRRQLLRNTNRSMGAEDALFAAKPANTPVARSSGVLLDILLGTAPSYSRSA